MFTVTDFDPFDQDSPDWPAYFNFCKLAGSPFRGAPDEFKEWVKARLKGNNTFKLVYQGDAIVVAMMSFSKKGVSGMTCFLLTWNV